MKLREENNKVCRAALGLAATTAITGMFGPTPAAADAGEERNLSAVVVTATRTPIEEFKAPANISVITREDLENGQYPDLGAALKDMPGLTIQNYGASGGNYSSNSIYINGSSKIVVLIDGMRANVNGSEFNRFSFSDLVDLRTIERIEVLKGSASTLYGSDAQGGVINIITRRAEEGRIDTTLGYTGGSYGLEQTNLRHAGSAQGFYWSIAAQKRSSGDYEDGSGKTIPESIDSTSFDAQLGKKFADGVSSVEVNYSRFDSDYMRPNNLGSRDFRPAYGEKKNERLALAYVQKIADGLVNRLSLFQNTSYLDDNTTRRASRWMMDLETRGISDQLTYSGDRHTLTGGIDYYQDRIKDYAISLDSYRGESLASTAIFAQDEWRFAEGWTLTPGLRIDHHSIYGNHSSPSIALNYIADNRTNYYLSYKEFFVAPTQYQTFSPTYGNVGLEPETGHTAEAGIKHKFDATTNGAVNIYSRRSKDAVVWQATGINMGDGRYMNVQREEAWGASASLTKQFLRYFTANVAYTYTDIDAQPGANRNRDGQLPRHAWNLGLNFTQDKLAADLLLRGQVDRLGRRADTYPSRLEDVWVVDLAASYRFLQGGKVFAKLNNVFDKHYTERTYYADPTRWYPQPGRNFQLGLEYTF